MGIPAQPCYRRDLGVWSCGSLTSTGLRVQQLLIILHAIVSVGLQGTDNLPSWAYTDVLVARPNGRDHRNICARGKKRKLGGAGMR